MGKLFQKIHFFSFDAFPKGSPPQKTKPFFSCESFPKFVYPPNHPRVFVRFGKTKGEIQVKKDDFRGDFFLRSLDLLWESATPPTHIWENFPKNTFYFLGGSHHKSQITKKHAIDETIKIANAIHLPKLFEYILILTPGAGQKRSPFTNHPAWPKGHKRPVRLFS